MKIIRLDVPEDGLSAPDAGAWGQVSEREFPLVPTPLQGNPGIKAVSPFLEKSTDHGRVARLHAAAAHNGKMLAVRLRWNASGRDRITDLDQFVDGVAVMFPLSAGASAVTMGSPSDPVNAWYWKGNLAQEAFDVVATGYGTSARSRAPALPIACTARYAAGEWQVVLRRALTGTGDRVQLVPGAATGMAFAVWDGANRERSGRKSFSGDFVTVSIES